jgi:hypothetical protein
VIENAPLLAIEILLGFGVPLVWGVWQLISLRRDNRRAAEEEAARSARSAEADQRAGNDACD